MSSGSWLPLPDAGAQEEPPSVSAEPRLQGLRILVAEDNAVSREVLAHLLGRAGAHATIVENGERALAEAAGAGFDCALFDVQMPGLSGMDAVRLLRRREGERNRRLPVIALTAYSMESDHERILQAGFDACLVKPLRLAALREILRALGVVRE